MLAKLTAHSRDLRKETVFNIQFCTQHIERAKMVSKLICTRQWFSYTQWTITICFLPNKDDFTFGKRFFISACTSISGIANSFHVTVSIWMKEMIMAEETAHLQTACLTGRGTWVQSREASEKLGSWFGGPQMLGLFGKDYEAWPCWRCVTRRGL